MSMTRRDATRPDDALRHSMLDVGHRGRVGADERLYVSWE